MTLDVEGLGWVAFEVTRRLGAREGRAVVGRRGCGEGVKDEGGEEAAGTAVVAVAGRLVMAAKRCLWVVGGADGGETEGEVVVGREGGGGDLNEKKLVSEPVAVLGRG